MPVGGPLEIVDPTGEDLELLLQNEFVAGPPDPDGPGHVGGGDPLAVGGVAGHGGGVGVLGVDRDVKRVSRLIIITDLPLVYKTVLDLGWPEIRIPRPRSVVGTDA